MSRSDKTRDAAPPGGDERGGAAIVVARYAGYCYGVERALRIAEEAGVELAPPIYTLGPLIHNPSVVERLARRGIAAIDDLDEVESGTVIVRTHGVDPEVVAAARARGLEVIDATCPFVNVAHQKAEMLREQGYIPVILGEKDHPEVVGLLAWAGPRADGRRGCRRAAPARHQGQARRGGRADHPDARQPGTARLPARARGPRDARVQHDLRRHRQAPGRRSAARRVRSTS